MKALLRAQGIAPLDRVENKTPEADYKPNRRKRQRAHDNTEPMVGPSKIRIISTTDIARTRSIKIKDEEDVEELRALRVSPVFQRPGRFAIFIVRLGKNRSGAGKGRNKETSQTRIGSCVHGGGI